MRAAAALLAPLFVALLLAPAVVPAIGLVDVPPVNSPVPLIKLQPVARGLALPLFATDAGDGSGRLFIVEQVGRVRVLQNGVLDATPYLDVTSKVLCCGEQGLLGIAFHPNFAQNGKLFVSYTRAGDGWSVLASYTVADPANGRPDPASAKVLLTQYQPFSNHNGGDIAFSPVDHFLYFGLGDGGAGGDPYGNGQNTNTLLGKMLRIDVDGASPYAIPPTNPYALLGGGKAEIFAMGLRNPWRWSFDKVTGDLWIGDVGQNAWEEIDYSPVSAAAVPGQPTNYGWNCWEGMHAYNANCNGVGKGVLTFPVLEYGHNLGCAVIGGYAYRGTAIPALQGTYLYGDLCSGSVWGAFGVGPARVAVKLLNSGQVITSFGQDGNGELYLVSIFGTVFKIVPA